MIEVTERFSARQLSPRRSGRRVFDVSGVVEEIDAVNATGVPGLGNGFPGDTSLFVQEPPSAARVAFGRWAVTVTYAPFEGAGNLPPTGDDDLRVRWGVSLEQVPDDTDVNGDPVTNSSRNAFDPPPRRRVVTARLTVLAIKPGPFDASQAVDFTGTVNSVAFSVGNGASIAAAGQALCVGIKPTGTYRLDTTPVEIQYDFEIRGGTNPWQSRIPDMGVEAFGTTMQNELVKAPIYTAGPEPEPVTSPVPLNGKGIPLDTTLYQIGRFPLAPTEQGVPTGASLEPTGEMVFLRYQTVEERNFNLLGISN